MKRGHQSPEIAEKKQGVAGLFGRAAPTYDRVGPRFFSYFGRRLVEFAEIPSGARVLDVATGTGAVLFPAVEAVGPRGHVTGIDLSEAMVQEIAEEVGRLKLRNVEVRQMDAEYLQFSDASFDFVLCGFAVFFFPQSDRALSEMCRVLKPHGRIAITTWGRLFVEQWKWFNELVAAHLRPEGETEQASDSQSPRPSLLDEPEELRGIITIAGFTDVQIVTETAEFIYADEEEWWSSLWSHGMREGLEKVEKATGTAGLERFKAAVFERLRNIRQDDGIHQLFEAIFALART